MKRTELNFIQKIWLEFLWLGARVFAVMPYWFKYYIVENLLFFILYYFVTLFIVCIKSSICCRHSSAVCIRKQRVSNGHQPVRVRLII